MLYKIEFVNYSICLNNIGCKWGNKARKNVKIHRMDCTFIAQGKVIVNH
jgi:hypothetical protein